MENLKLSKHLNWRQRFVVLAEGCCYCFDDEVAHAPTHKFSLSGFNRLQRTASERNQFCFLLEPRDKSHSKTHVFACSSEEDRKLWMQAFKGAMLEANASELNSSRENSVEDDLFKELEKPLFETEDPVETSGYQMEIDAADGGSEVDSDDSGSSSNSDYDYPEEEELEKIRKPPNRRTVPLPPIPGAEQSKSPPPLPKPTAPPRAAGKNKPLDPRKRESATLPKPPTAEKPRPQRLTERDCLFDNNDREAAIKILREKKVPGTFLIRKSRQGDSKVLAVMTSDDVKEYKIFIEDGQVSLDKKTFFHSVEDLLENYSRAPLPNRTQTLGRAFSSHQVGGHPHSPS